MTQNDQQQYHQAVKAAHQAIQQAQLNGTPEQFQLAQQHVNQAQENLQALVKEHTLYPKNSYK